MGQSLHVVAHSCEVYVVVTELLYLQSSASFSPYEHSNSDAISVGSSGGMPRPAMVGPLATLNPYADILFTIIPPVFWFMFFCPSSL